MRRILTTFRSRNHIALFLVIKDEHLQTMEVWQCNPNIPMPMDHCRTFPFNPDPNPLIRSRSEATAARLALSLADELSRMSNLEMSRQIDNVKQFGEVR